MSFCPRFIDVNGPHGTSARTHDVRESPRQMALRLALIGRRVPDGTPDPPPLSRRLRAALRAEAESRR